MRRKYKIVLQTEYEVDSVDSLQGQVAAIGVAAGCQADTDQVGAIRELGKCSVLPKSSTLVSCELLG